MNLLQHFQMRGRRWLRNAGRRRWRPACTAGAANWRGSTRSCYASRSTTPGPCSTSPPLSKCSKRRFTSQNYDWYTRRVGRLTYSKVPHSLANALTDEHNKNLQFQHISWLAQCKTTQLKNARTDSIHAPSYYYYILLRHYTWTNGHNVIQIRNVILRSPFTTQHIIDWVYPILSQVQYNCSRFITLIRCKKAIAVYFFILFLFFYYIGICFPVLHWVEYQLFLLSLLFFYFLQDFLMYIYYCWNKNNNVRIKF